MNEFHIVSFEMDLEPVNDFRIGKKASPGWKRQGNPCAFLPRAGASDPTRDNQERENLKPAVCEDIVHVKS